MPLNLRTKSDETIFSVVSDDAKELQKKCIDLLKSVGYDLSHTMTYIKCLSNGNIELCIGFHSLGVITPSDNLYPEILFKRLYEVVREEVGSWNTGVIVLSNFVFDWFLATNELKVVSPKYDFTKKVIDNVNIRFYMSNEGYSVMGKDITKEVENCISTRSLKQSLKGTICNGAVPKEIRRQLDVCYSFPFTTEELVKTDELSMDFGLVWNLNSIPDRSKYVRMVIYNKKC